MVVAPEPQGGRLGRELIARQNAELGETAKGIAGGSVVCHTGIALVVQGNPEQPLDHVAGAERGLLLIKAFSVVSNSLVQLFDLKRRAVDHMLDPRRQLIEVTAKLFSGQSGAVQDVGPPCLLSDRDRVVDLGAHRRHEFVDGGLVHVALSGDIFKHPAGQAGSAAPNAMAKRWRMMTSRLSSETAGAGTSPAIISLGLSKKYWSCGVLRA